MPHPKLIQHSFLLPEAAKFPSTRYQGSKAKLADWIWKQIENFDFQTCLDAFGGTGSVSYRLKQAEKQVTYNDILKFNYQIGMALIANCSTTLSLSAIEMIRSCHSDICYPKFIQTNFRDIYFTDLENAWLDQSVSNIRLLENSMLQSVAFFALYQACIIKRSYNLFHRKNLYVRLADVERSFGNKASWDRPFAEWFMIFAEEANRAVFDNGKINSATNLDAFDIPGEFDLVYIDTPYIPKTGIGTDYLSFYHFLEGLTTYDEWEQQLDHRSKHLRFKPKPNVWTDKNQIHSAFDRLFCKYQHSIVVVSYRSDGIPSIEELANILRKYKPKVSIAHYGQYKYALSIHSKSEEVLLIGQ